MVLPLILYSASVSKIANLLAVSKAFSKSTKQIMDLFRCEVVMSNRVPIASCVDLCLMYPKRCLCKAGVSVCFSLFVTNLSFNLAVHSRSEMGRVLPGCPGFGIGTRSHEGLG